MRWILRVDTWFLEGCLEDIPEKYRDPSKLEYAVEYGSVFLQMVWEGNMPGREGLVANEVDFKGAKDANQKVVGVTL